MGNDLKGSSPYQEPGQLRRLMLARLWLKANMIPQQVFPEITLFGNPAWNIMLELYIAWHGRIAISVKSACIASGGSSTAAIRYIAALIGAGLIIKVPDLDDARRSNLQLTDRGLQAVELTIDRAAEADRKVGLGEIILVQRLERGFSIL